VLRRVRRVEISLRDEVLERGAEDVKIVALLHDAADVRRRHGGDHIRKQQEGPLTWVKRVFWDGGWRTP
jgi:hypothetical protein